MAARCMPAREITCSSACERPPAAAPPAPAGARPGSTAPLSRRGWRAQSPAARGPVSAAAAASAHSHAPRRAPPPAGRTTIQCVGQLAVEGVAAACARIGCTRGTRAHGQGCLTLCLYSSPSCCSCCLCACRSPSASLKCRAQACSSWCFRAAAWDSASSTCCRISSFMEAIHLQQWRRGACSQQRQVCREEPAAGVHARPSTHPALTGCPGPSAPAAARTGRLPHAAGASTPELRILQLCLVQPLALTHGS